MAFIGEQMENTFRKTNMAVQKTDNSLKLST